MRVDYYTSKPSPPRSSSQSSIIEGGGGLGSSVPGNGGSDVSADVISGEKWLADEAERQLLCVSFVDVVGFSALMRKDEESTFFRWVDMRQELVMPLLKEFGGSLVKSTGDGILATFDNPEAAVRWGQELQIQARQRRQGLALRISLNYCRVLRDGQDLLGDGVNVAARLQEHVAAGGIILTQSVQDNISHLSEIQTRPVGELELRKMGVKVAAFELTTDGRHMVAEERQSGLPSIAVLPFTNISGKQEDEYFAWGIVEDIVAQLSQHHDLTVIARSSTLSFARQAVDPQVVGRTLGVRYLIMGMLRRRDGRVRVSTELLDTENGQILAALKRDFDEIDTFGVQDEIVETTLINLLPKMLQAERRRTMRKRLASFSAYDMYLKALDTIGSLEFETFEQAGALLERAIEADPEFPSPLAWAARWHSLKVGQGWSTDPKGDSRKAADLAARAIRLDRQNALALATYGHVQSYMFGDFETAIDYLDRAREANPSSSIAWLLSSVTLSSIGRNDDAIKAAERALRLSPFDQRLFVYYAFLGTVYYDAGEYEKAISWLQRGLAENPRYTSALRTLVVAQVAAGKAGEAQKSAADLMKLEPAFSLGKYKETHKHYSDPAKSVLFCERLRQAGLPD
ncbi:adenylate/guanylate cyclase domain-containing protein [Ruegeria arenilitoris]|uniref:adenylate/guanylate cyclase domain-containing protein n=1 Tax=Ruegeria arenilitoris TaxID=1173585 RepID=UPI00147C6F67|nr:tetratricopeptide repeat protein [Ruegeria arenilitoris]